MRFNVNADLFRNVARAVSDEKTRYYLNGVLIQPHACGGVHLVATDGHRMIVAYDPDGSTDRDYIVPAPRDLLRPTARKKSRGMQWQDARRIVADGQTIKVMEDRDVLASLNIEPIDGTFPDWTRVVPTIKGEGSPSAHNPAYISDLMDMALDLRACGLNDCLPRIMSNGEGEPSVVLYGADAPLFAVLMPMRSSDPVMPAFYGARPYERPVVHMTSPYRGFISDRPHLMRSFSVTVKTSPVHPETTRTYDFPTHAAAARAFNRIRRNLEARGATGLPDAILPETVIPLDKIKERNQRVDAINGAAAVFGEATDQDLALPWRRALIPMQRTANVGTLKRPKVITIDLPVATAVGDLPHLSEARLLATAYRMAA